MFLCAVAHPSITIQQIHGGTESWAYSPSGHGTVQ